MLSKLAIQNIKGNKGYFIAYILTIALFISIVYQLPNIKEQINPYINQKAQGFNLEQTFNFLKNFFYVIVALFAMYISRFFIKRRSKEIALLKTLGLNRKNIWLMFLIENIIVVVIGFIIGILTGVLFTRLFGIISVNLVGFKVETINFGLSSEGFKDVFLLTIIIYLIISIIPLFNISKTSIITLFQEQNKQDSVTKKPILSMILFVVFTALLVYQATIYIPNLEGWDNLSVILYILNACLVAIFLYRGFLIMIFNSKHNKNARLKSVVSLISFSHLATNVKQLYKMMSLITITSAILMSTIIISFGYFNSMFSSDLLKTSFIYASKNQEVANNLNTATKKVFPDLIKTNIYYIDTRRSDGTKVRTFIYKKSDIETLARVNGFDYSFIKSIKSAGDVDLKEEDLLRILTKANLSKDDFTKAEDEKYYNLFIDAGRLYGVDQSNGFSKQFELANVMFFEDDNQIFNKLNSYPLTISKDSINNENIFNAHSLLNSDDFKNNNDFQILSNVIMIVQIKIFIGVLQIITLLTMFIVTISLLMAIFFRNLENLEKGLNDYIIAKNIGMSKKQIIKANLIESLLTQILPFMVGAIVTIPLLNQLFFSPNRVSSMSDVQNSNVLTYLFDPSIMFIILTILLFMFMLVGVLMFIIVNSINKTNKVK